MSSRRAFVLAAVAAVSGGCALASGYDFGKYTETGGAAGTGGRAASATASSGMGAASSTTSSGHPASASSTSTASTSGTGATVGPSTTSSAMISSSSSGTGGSPPGTITVLYDNLLGPENLAIDPEYVYFTLNVPGTQKSGAGYVSKEGKTRGIWDSLEDSVPAIWSTGSALYIARNVSGVGYVTSFNVTMNQMTGVATEPNAIMQGLSVWGSTVFFTSQGANTWYIPPAGQPGTFVPNDIAAGPITADSSGVFYVDVNARVMQASLNGGIASPIGMAPDTVHGITTDFSSVYWTDQSGGLYRATKGANTAPPVTLVAPDTTPSFGLAIDSSDTTIYYAHGSNLELVTFPWGAPKVLVTGLVSPRGVAVDDTYVYVADYGSGMAADGRILRITR